MTSAQAGASLDELLRESTIYKTLLPTRGQLQTLLASLEERCQSARFTDIVVGWQIMIEQSGMFPSSPPMALRSRSEQRFNLLPPPYGICKLVDALRQLGNRDEFPKLRVTVCATSCASWVIAFVQWCMGSPPSVLTQDESTIFKQSESQITVILDSNPAGYHHFEISFDQLTGGQRLLLSTHSSPGARWAGMISIASLASYTEYRSYDLGYTTRESFCAFQEACAYTLGDITRGSYRMMFKGEFDYISASQAASSYPEDNDLSRALTLLLGDGTPLALCRSTNYTYYMDHIDVSSCRPKHLSAADVKRAIAETVATTFLLSHFENPEELLVDIGYVPTLGGLDMRSFLSSLSGFSEHFRNTTNEALILVGQERHLDEEPPWVLSGRKGQTVYPAIVESSMIRHRGNTRLAWAKGKLQYKGETYRSVWTSDRDPDWEIPTPVLGLKDPPEMMLEPRNMFSDLELHWKVNPAEEGLCLTLGAKRGRSTSHHVQILLHRIIQVLSRTTFAESCRHSRSEKLASPDRNCSYTGPGYTEYVVSYIRERLEARGPEEFRVFVLPTDGNETTRFLSLVFAEVNSGEFMIRQNACLGCCIAVCRQLCIKFLIL